MNIVVLGRQIHIGLLGLGEVFVPRGTVPYVRTHFLYLLTHWKHLDLYQYKQHVSHPARGYSRGRDPSMLWYDCGGIAILRTENLQSRTQK